MRKLKKSLYLIPLLIISVISAIPFYFIISMATHSTAEIYRGEFILWGDQLLKNLETIVKGGFMKYYWNSFYSAALSSFLCLLISAMAAYGLTIYKFRLKNSLKNFIVASMMIPGQISLIGYAIEMKNFGFINTHMPLILTWAASAYSVYFIVQYITNALPMELVESARIDGSGEFRTFFSIAVPLIRPAIGTLAMLIFLWSWNNFLMPSTVLTQSDKFTLPLGIQTLATAYTQDWGARGAALAISVLPILVIFAFGSKYFIKGLAAGAVKG